MKYIHLFVSILAITSCGDDCRKDFNMPQKGYTGDELEISGYYYSQDNDKSVFFILYRNGVIFGGLTVEGDTTEIENFLESDYFEDQKELVWSWGIFDLDNNNITIEKWISTDGGCYPTRTYKGSIVNDTTFTLDYSKFDTFHFRHFSPKPDSTNQFIP